MPGFSEKWSFSSGFSPKTVDFDALLVKIGQFAQNTGFLTWLLGVSTAALVMSVLAPLLQVSTPATPPTPPPPQLIPPGMSMREACNMQTPPNTALAARQGEVRIRWAFGVESVCGPGAHYGCTTRKPDGLNVVEMTEDPPAFDDICGLARLGHEITHAMGADHPK